MFTEAIIRAETAQQAQRAALSSPVETDKSRGVTDGWMERVRKIAATNQASERFDAMCNPPPPSSATPMERFALLSTVNDPFVLECRGRAPGKSGTEGSMEAVQFRTQAAKSIATAAIASRKHSVSSAATRGSAQG